MKLTEATKLTGKSRTALLRAIQDHKLSAQKDERGHWEIDPAELVRVYDVRIPEDDEGVRHAHVRTPVSGAQRIGSGAHPDTSQISENDMVPRAQLEAIERLSEERGKTIEDLRTRLDRTEGKLDAAQEKLTALLVDHRADGPQEPAERTLVRPGYWAALALALALCGALWAYQQGIFTL